MEKEPVISVIVPVYNAKKTLSRCVDSILAQTLKELEVVLVDDGSVDGVDELCDEYNEKHENVKTIHQKNKGPLAARIAGCRIARGKYISFVDSDDWVEENMYEDLCQELADADLLASGLVRNLRDGSLVDYIYNSYPAGEYDMYDSSFLQNVFFRGNYVHGRGNGILLTGPYAKIFRRNLFFRIFDEANTYIREREDWLMNFLYLLQCKKIKISDKCYYHYVKNPSSIGHTINPDYLRQQNDLYDILKEAVKGHQYEETLLIQAQRGVVANMFHAGIKMGFHEEALLPVYRFKGAETLKNKKIVLFGAGMVGKNYFVDFHRRGIDVVRWLDNHPDEGKNWFGQSPVLPSQLDKVDYDYVVCAIRGEKAAESMRKQLIAMGINGEKILWEDPIYTVSEYFSSQHS